METGEGNSEIWRFELNQQFRPVAGQKAEMSRSLPRHERIERMGRKGHKRFIFFGLIHLNPA